MVRSGSFFSSSAGNCNNTVSYHFRCASCEFEGVWMQPSATLHPVARNTSHAYSVVLPRACSPNLHQNLNSLLAETGKMTEMTTMNAIDEKVE